MNIKEEYEQKTEAKLNELHAEIEKLRAKADNVEADAKLKYKVEIEKLSVIKEDFSQKLTALKEAGNSNWEKRKSDIEKLTSAMEGTLKSIISKFQ